MDLVNHSSQSSAARAVGGALFAALVLFALAARSPLATGASGERPGDLGLLAVELPAHLPEGFDPERHGALVSWVLDGGPADRADVREGDIVLQFDNKPISGAADLLGRIRRLGAGHLASMVIWRDGREINTGLMTLGERGRYPGEIVGPKDGHGAPGAGGYGSGYGNAPPGRDSRQEMRITELERELGDLNRDLTDLRRRVERLEATDRSMIGR
jgi:hypothetical protein